MSKTRTNILTGYPIRRLNILIGLKHALQQIYGNDVNNINVTFLKENDDEVIFKLSKNKKDISEEIVISIPSGFEHFTQKQLFDFFDELLYRNHEVIW